MPSFTSQIEAIAGDSSDFTAQIPTWLDNGVKVITDFLISSGSASSMLTTERVGPFSSSSGYTIADNVTVVKVKSNGYTAVPISPQIYEESIGSTSIYRRGPMDPAFTIFNGKVYVAGGHSSENYADIVTYGVADDALGTITNFPLSLVHAVVLFVSSRLAQAKITSYIQGEEDIELGKAMEQTVQYCNSEYEKMMSIHSGGRRGVQ